MSQEPPAVSSHRSLWRRLRRRFRAPSPSFFLISWLSTLVPAVCAVAWMLRDQGWGWIAFLTGVFWFLGSAVSLLPMLLTLFVFRPRKSSGETAVPLTPAWGLYLLSRLLTLLALLCGRVDIAVYLSYGHDILSGLSGKQQIHSAFSESILIKAVLLLAFATNTVWLFVLMLALDFRRKFAMPPLVETLRSKPTRREYVTRTREACAAGGG